MPGRKTYRLNSTIPDKRRDDRHAKVLADSVASTFALNPAKVFVWASKHSIDLKVLVRRTRLRPCRGDAGGAIRMKAEHRR
jgi:hypothetical protein